MPAAADYQEYYVGLYDRGDRVSFYNLVLDYLGTLMAYNQNCLFILKYSEILALHRKNQTIYGETLTLLTLLLPHLGSSDSDLVDIRVNYMVLASGFWYVSKKGNILVYVCRC